MNENKNPVFEVLCCWMLTLFFLSTQLIYNKTIYPTHDMVVVIFYPN